MNRSPVLSGSRLKLPGILITLPCSISSHASHAKEARFGRRIAKIYAAILQLLSLYQFAP
jgi:hypothetical protein